MYHTYESKSLIWFVLNIILMRLENDKYSEGVNISGGETSGGETSMGWNVRGVKRPGVKPCEGWIIREVNHPWGWKKNV